MTIRRCILIAMLMSAPALAQPGDPPDPTVPIGGIEALLVSGALFGIKKILSRSKKTNDEG